MEASAMLINGEAHTSKTHVESTSPYDLDLDMQEDDDFIAAPTLKIPLGDEKTVAIDAASSSSSSSTAASSLALSRNSTFSDVMLEEVDSDDLVEDPTFAAQGSSPAASARMISSSEGRDGEDQQTAGPARGSSGATASLVTDDDDDDAVLPSATQLIQAITGRPLDVSRLDLGRHTHPTRQLQGTTSQGKTVLFKRRKGNALVGEHVAYSSSSSSTTKDRHSAELGKLAVSLLEKPMHVLLDNVEKASRAAVAAAEAAMSAGTAPGAHEIIQKHKDKNPGNDQQARSNRDGKGKARQTHTSWTDRYKPRTFTELLGDERTHRQAMGWLKEWDSCVFKTVKSINHKKTFKRALDGSKFAPTDAKEETDPLGRPKDKILLLTGPPGLGKTTMAHVIAHQAGYQVMEVNASDDRSAKTVQDKIRNSLESRALSSLGALSSNKPTCLIIDEIDGAAGGDGGFIKTLVKLVVDGSRTGPTAPKTGKKGKKDAQPLLRPIICICNDLYAPALRPLRSLARIVRFKPPTNAHLLKRLKTVCDHEGLRTDSKSLTTLIEVAEGDMRSCLNTLEIIRKQSDVLDDRVIRSTSLGLKDTATSVSAVWDKLFKIPAKKRQRGIESNSNDGRYVSSLVKDITTCGEYDKLAQTCFENYLTTKNPADALKAVGRALDWLHVYDRLDSRLRSDRDYDVMPYMAYTFVPWNPLFAAVSNKTPEWARIDYEMYLKRTAHQEIADTLKKALPVGLKSSFNGTHITSELAPLLLRIVSPDLKPLNQQLVKAEDRTALKKVVRIMADLQIAFLQDKNEEGQVVFKLEPPIDVFVHYDGKRASDIPAARYNLRQLVSQELEAEVMRRAGTGESGAMDKDRNAKSKSAVGDLMAAYKKTAEIVNPQSAKEAAAVDFFGRPIAAPQAKPTATTGEADEDVFAAAPPKKKAKVLYKYHEGFSNAVRTNIKVLELFR